MHRRTVNPARVVNTPGSAPGTPTTTQCPAGVVVAQDTVRFSRGVPTSNKASMALVCARYPKNRRMPFESRPSSTSSLNGVRSVVACISGCEPEGTGSIPVEHPICFMPVAQRIRAPAYEAGGCRFNPCRACQLRPHSNTHYNASERDASGDICARCTSLVRTLHSHVTRNRGCSNEVLASRLPRHSRALY